MTETGGHPITKMGQENGTHVVPEKLGVGTRELLGVATFAGYDPEVYIVNKNTAATGNYTEQNFYLNSSTQARNFAQMRVESTDIEDATRSTTMTISTCVNGVFGPAITIVGRDTVLTGQLRTPLGTASLPSYSFDGDTNTGMYRAAADNLGFTTNGVARLTMNTSAIYPWLPIRGTLGSAGAPSYSFSEDTNTGMYRSGVDALSFATGGTRRATVNSTGLDIVGSITTTGLINGEDIETIGANYQDASNLASGSIPAARFNDTSHGNRSGGSLHALATTSSHGFMSNTDKSAFDTMSSNYRSASYLNTGTLPASRFNDTSHGNRAGGSTHSVATTSSHGFMSSTDKRKVDATIVISTQAEFTALFSNGATLTNTNIFLKKTSLDYFVLYYVVNLGSNCRILSDGAIVRRGNNTAKFTAIATSTTWIENIHLEGWYFDGQGGITHTGHTGNTTSTGTGGSFIVSGRGGFLSMEYVKNSKFLCHVSNCRATYGGAYNSLYTNSSKNNVYANISYCYASSNGGACHYTSYSTFSNINYCSAGTLGGACYICSKSDFSNINYCHADTSGGACYDCEKSTFTDITFCSADVGGGACHTCAKSTFINISHCSATNGGGACSTCEHSTFSNLLYCTTDSFGGACYNCDQSTFSNIRNCTAGSNGGACSNCDYATITAISECTADSGYGGACYGCHNSLISMIHSCSANIGGACAYCNYTVFIGSFRFNSALGSRDVIDNCTGIAFIMNASTPYIVTTYGSLEL